MNFHPNKKGTGVNTLATPHTARVGTAQRLNTANRRAGLVTAQVYAQE